MKNLHTFVKYLFDVILSVLWVYVPLFHFNLRQSPHAIVIWVVDLGTLAVLLYLLHSHADKQFI